LTDVRRQLAAHRGPTLGGAIGLALGLAGIAVSLTDRFKNDKLAVGLLVGAGALILGSALWVAARRTLVGCEDLVRRWVREEVASQGTLVKERDANLVEQSQREEEFRLRAALNEIQAELTTVEQLIAEDDAAYWLTQHLPTEQWARHCESLARGDDRVYASLSAVYREIDRINKCIDEQPREGEYGIRLRVTIVDCESERFAAALACTSGEIRRLRGLLPTFRLGSAPDSSNVEKR